VRKTHLSNIVATKGQIKIPIRPKTVSKPLATISDQKIPRKIIISQDIGEKDLFPDR